ncbi:MAG: histone deacetylase [Deltaproteobacteria bacterium]|nr:MAG: histone deacetylase [Deltaproteobacteria bacterium]
MGTTGIVFDDVFRLHDPGPGHPESPRRLEAIEKRLKAGGQWERLERVEAREAGEEEVCLVHDHAYWKKVLETAGRPVMLDPDTVTSAHSVEAARRAAGGTVELVKKVVEGGLSNGYALVRPPGHHAERARAMGFCIFNNVAVAAEYAIRHLGLSRVAIVDWDLHHGNGTQHAFYDRADVLYISTHQYPYYPGTGAAAEVGSGDGIGYTINVPLHTGMDDEAFIDVFLRVVKPALRAFGPELVLVSTGYDIYAGDPLGGMDVTGEGFGLLAAIVKEAAGETCGGRLVAVLEGGYNLEGLSEGVCNVVDVLLDKGVSVPDRPASSRASGIIEQVIERHRGNLLQG